MCAPKTPKIEPTPVRAASVLPNGGDPAIRAQDRNRRRIGFGASTIANAAMLGTPATSNPLGMTGGG